MKIVTANFSRQTNSAYDAFPKRGGHLSTRARFLQDGYNGVWTALLQTVEFKQYGERVDEPYFYEKRFCICWLSRLVTEWNFKEEPHKDGRLLLQVLEDCVEKVAFHNVEFSSKLCDKCGLRELARGLDIRCQASIRGEA